MLDFSKQIDRLERFLDGRVMMFLLCIIIFFSGVVFAQIFSGETIPGAIEKFLSYLGSLATLMAAVAAFLAIQDWRHQFAHKERFAALVRLRGGIEKLKCIMKLANSLHRIYLGSLVKLSPEEKSEAFQKESREFAEIHQEYNATLREAGIFLSAKESMEFPGSELEINKLVVMITLIVNSILNEKDLDGKIKDYVLKVADHEDEIRRVIKAADDYLVDILAREV